MKRIFNILLLFVTISISGCVNDNTVLGTTTLEQLTNDTSSPNNTILSNTTVATDITTEDITTIPSTTTSKVTSTTSLSTVDFVNQILSELTLHEKAAQMVQAERGNISAWQVELYGIGSILSGGGSHPNSYNDSVGIWYDMYANYQSAALDSSSGIPLIYGIDAVHGNNNLYGTTIFPHNIGLGMANDFDLVYQVSKATAEEMLVTGINWTFAPALSVVQNIRWGRTYEGFSENPEVHLNLTQSAILGFEENGVSATAKHFFGDGGTLDGIDQGNLLSANESLLRTIHLAPYLEAVEAGVDTVMVSYSSINNEKMHGSDYWVNDILKDELNFEGFVVSDWNGIHQLPGSFEDQIVISINAGIDMLMEPSDWEQAILSIVNAVQNSRISIERINDAVSRILKVKYERGLFDSPTYHLDPSYLYNQEHQDIAREAVRKSLVLLKNENNSLPLAKNDSIYITGPGSDNVGYLCGGWTTYWQGNSNSDIGVGQSIKDSMTNILSSNSKTMATTWQNANTVVVVLTETPYSEGVGDNSNMTLTGGNAHPDNAAALLIASQAKQAGKNVVGILISGRPLLLENYLSYFDSFIAAWLPGSEGGVGINDVLFGDYDFYGKLSFTWPINYEQIGYNSNREDYNEESVLFPYGYGLKYDN